MLPKMNIYNQYQYHASENEYILHLPMKYIFMGSRSIYPTAHAVYIRLERQIHRPVPDSLYIPQRTTSGKAALPLALSTSSPG